MPSRSAGWRRMSLRCRPHLVCGACLDRIGRLHIRALPQSLGGVTASLPHARAGDGERKVLRGLGRPLGGWEAAPEPAACPAVASHLPTPESSPSTWQETRHHSPSRAQVVEVEGRSWGRAFSSAWAGPSPGCMPGVWGIADPGSCSALAVHLIIVAVSPCSARRGARGPVVLGPSLGGRWPCCGGARGHLGPGPAAGNLHAPPGGGDERMDSFPSPPRVGPSVALISLESSWEV